MGLPQVLNSAASNRKRPDTTQVATPFPVPLVSFNLRQTRLCLELLYAAARPTQNEGNWVHATGEV